jgi:hypothetical protein
MDVELFKSALDIKRAFDRELANRRDGADVVMRQ